MQFSAQIENIQALPVQNCMLKGSNYNLMTAEYLLRRTKGTYYKYGHKAGRLLTLQVKRQTASNFILQIYDSSHSLTTNPAEIKMPLLLTFILTCINLILLQIRSQWITSLIAQIYRLQILTLEEELEKPIQMEELISCLKLMQNNKAPGPDGFPVDFYKKFSDQLAAFQLDILNDSLKRGSLPPTLNQGSISIIPKKDKKLVECSSWRPISLLNSDVKLLS